jgi:hypothetical protein
MSVWPPSWSWTSYMGADLSGWLLEVAPFDDRVAGSAPQQDDGSGAGGDPGGAVYVGEGGRLGAAGSAYDDMVQLDELDTLP